MLVFVNMNIGHIKFLCPFSHCPMYKNRSISDLIGADARLLRSLSDAYCHIRVEFAKFHVSRIGMIGIGWRENFILSSNAITRTPRTAG